MDIVLDGLIIKYEESEFETALKLKCECGHVLWEHAFNNKESLKQIITGQCLYCGVKDYQYVCKHFRVSPDAR